MADNFTYLPFAFYASAVALIVFSIQAWLRRDSCEGIPMLMVFLTVGFWYLGDALYNDYTLYVVEIGPPALNAAWWEVLLFIVSFGLLAPIVHRQFNFRYLGRTSKLMLLTRQGSAKMNWLQNQSDVICRVLAVIWVIIMLIALLRTNFDFQGLFMPYLGSKAEAWSRNRVGTGFDALIALVTYILIGLTAVFGIIAALATHRSTRIIAGVVYFLALPNYVFDRTRSTMLATVIPGFFAWIFLRMRGHLLIRLGVLLAGMLVVEAWLKFVIENRSDVSIATAFAAEMNNGLEQKEKTKHLGLNMYEELGYVNAYLADGSYRPNWGTRYFAELVNPIPRVLWPGKPMIGMDYAIARGMGYGDAADSQGGVQASISTGMIGQGVVNFGVFFGPIAAALLMSVWVAILARMDVRADVSGRLYVYALGLFLTFNMGRDITLLVIYPFCFGYILVVIADVRRAAREGKNKNKRPADEVNPLSRLEHAAVASQRPLAHRQLAPRYRIK